MAKQYDIITDDMQAFIEAQKMFFVATAPPPEAGRVNLSPKGMNSFRVLGPNRVTYLDSVGSGNETAAHLRDNGRITIMFCAFEGVPQILRLYGTGTVIGIDHPQWNETLALFPDRPGSRQIMDITVHQTQISCGEGVPLYDYIGDRNGLEHWAQKMGTERMNRYQRDKNAVSIDGLPTGISLPETIAE